MYVPEDGLLIRKLVIKASDEEYNLCGKWWLNVLLELQYSNNRDKRKDGKLKKQDGKDRKKYRARSKKHKKKEGKK